MNIFKRLLALAVIGCLASACAQPARTAAMVSDVSPTTVVAENSPLKDSIAVGGVTGGEETNPLWTSEVSSADFQQALTLSLKQHTMLAEGNGPMTLAATLVNMDQPLISAST